MNHSFRDMSLQEKIEYFTDKPLVVIAGPTAVGKTKLSISLAKAIGAEVVSADSMQVYRRMDIGSAKILPKEMQGVRHHLIDVLDPEDDFHVVLFQSMALEAMYDIYSRGKIPILAGGTGFYVQAVTRLIDFTENEADEAYRRELQAYADSFGPIALHEKLARIDPEAASEIPSGNVKRVIRAMEYYKVTGEKISVHNAKEREKKSPFRLYFYCLTDERSVLYDRINKRVDAMMEAGLLEEVMSLRERGLDSGKVSMQGLGYKQILQYLEGKQEGASSLEEAVDRIKLETRHFAKRQLTWFRREAEVRWIHKGEFSNDDEAICAHILKELQENGE